MILILGGTALGHKITKLHEGTWRQIKTLDQ